jgi:magnesium transporter
MKLTGRVMRSTVFNGGVVDNAIYVDGVRTANPVTLDETYELLRERHGMAWIGLYRPTSEEIGSVAAEFGLHHLVVDDAIAAHQRPKLERYGAILFTVLRPARYDDRREQVEFGELHVVTGGGFVVSIRHAESPNLASVRRRLESQPYLLRLGPEAVLYSIMDQVVDEYAPVVAGLENDIDEIEDQLFNNDPAVSRRIYALTREVIEVQRATRPLLGIIDALSAGSISTTSTSSCSVTSATSATTSCGSSNASTPSARCSRTRWRSTPPWSVSARTMRSNG